MALWVYLGAILVSQDGSLGVYLGVLIRAPVICTTAAERGVQFGAEKVKHLKKINGFTMVLLGSNSDSKMNQSIKRKQPPLGPV